jgi:hypothetical protein
MVYDLKACNFIFIYFFFFFTQEEHSSKGRSTSSKIKIITGGTSFQCHCFIQNGSRDDFCFFIFLIMNNRDGFDKHLQVLPIMEELKIIKK